MGDIRSNPVPPGAVPCPHCGYDLRGHTDETVCPECGRSVHVSLARSDAFRWIDMRLLDLWSIGVVQTVGCAAGLLSLLAIRRGHYVALLLGMMAGLCMSAASLWFVALVPAIVLRTRRPAMRVLGLRRLRPLFLWCVLDAAFACLAGVIVKALMRA